MQLINIRHLAFAFALGILGLLVNLVPIQLFGNQQLVIGNMFFVIVAIFIGPWYALLTALLCTTGLYIAWDSWHTFLLFPLEALWLGYARRKEFYSLYADIVYWSVVGIPLFYIYLNLLSELPDHYFTFIILKQGINGLFYTVLASILVTLLPVQFHIKDKITNQKRKSFNQQLTYTFIQILTLVLLVSALIFNNHSLDQQQLAVKHSLEDSANHLGKATQAFIDDHYRTIDNAARWLSFGSDQSQWQGLLSKLHQSYPNFISMLITDDQGLITAASPIDRLNRSDGNNKTLSVMNRHYFQEAFFNQLTFISPAFLGRGFGNDPIVAISAPLYQATNQIKPVGILEGSLNLTKFAQIDHRDRGYETRSIILVDENNLIIYASESLKMQPLKPLQFSMSGLNYKTKLKMINFNHLDSESPEYAYSKYILNNGWSLYVVVPFSPLLAQVEQQYLMTFTVLLFSFITTILLIQVISGRLTTPLEVIATKFSSGDMNGSEKLLLNDTTPKEICTLSRSIQKSKLELLSYQLELEEKVALRTVELEKANIQLQALSEMDELTGLYNRRYTETHFPTLHDMCKRNCSALAFCIVDIDHFKRINDTYGHQAGDKALITLAKLMKQFFKRDTDIISRYGGEEFLIILPQCNVLQVEIHLNQFRQLIADTEIEMNSTERATLTVSIGAVISNAGEFNNIDHWFKMADLNLYEAKESGRNKVISSLLAE
ncbi:sensor domain-containing diguanylate cyclase [Shewanella psychrotolerans]|uniref:sensor domain-containing diguanylate cyclase n=1 Tax=Shewanella psychrotolerans TaxID=2864206 RepID=UPI001C658B11|nr:diguanylate cyclase [Shewanella psychrotolerans]QYK00221.1 diguanylate cyclase [Shewanella psychrotolerans]